ncbi:M16 family metallopeptidase [Chromatocurvus halotolerans]|uniref:Putative Zn-dependent peptidase n=1 Tax=Chromatocurvus halotolerans TaxID=1132028 RepID=A0A4R2L0M8_9GAMM|nr:insulinase family protein [Chromatocurvus halotolerans]TCO76088.1 putative Zn-dependent peptidase [Chromatocurvus halotolerans]
MTHLTASDEPAVIPRFLSGWFPALLVAGATALFVGVANADSRYDLPIREHVFDNGLRLLVLERPGDPRVAAKIFTDMGAIHETPGRLGAAHFQEHLMFKGTPTLGTTDWGQEQPIRERMKAVEAALIEEKNRARNVIRQRGAIDSYQHQAETPRMAELRAQLAALEAESTKYRLGGAPNRWYQAFGGTNLTATTEQEYMKFDINLPVERIDLFFRVEADRMVNTVFREFEQERMILVEQRLGDLNSPSTPYYEQMSAMTGLIHPVFWPEGYMTDFFEYTRTSQRDLYEEYFVVNNSTIVLIGGVSLEAMIPRVEHYFGWMEAAPEPTRTPAVEPRPAAERRLVYRNDDIEPRVEHRYLIPGVGHPDRPAFDVLGRIASARLSAAASEEGIGARVNVNTRVIHTDRFGVPATINFELILDNEAQLADAETLLASTLDSLTQAPTREEVARAQKALRADWYRTARDASALAFEIGHFQTMDRWQTLQGYLEARDTTTASDIARLGERYFIDDNRTVGIARSRSNPTHAEAMR